MDGPDADLTFDTGSYAVSPEPCHLEDPTLPVKFEPRPCAGETREEAVDKSADEEDTCCLMINMDAFCQWQTIAKRLDIKRDSQVALLLMQSFEKTAQGGQATHCVKCHGRLILSCSKCDTIVTSSSAVSGSTHQQIFHTGQQADDGAKQSGGESVEGLSNVQKNMREEKDSAPTLFETSPGEPESDGEQTEDAVDSPNIEIKESLEVRSVSRNRNRKPRDCARLRTVKNRFKCDQCSATFIARASLKRHKLMHKGEKPFVCDKCPRRFFTRNELDLHRIVHRDDKPFSCDECGVTFKRKISLDLHKKIHSGEKTHICNVCGKAFLHKYALHTHHTRKHLGLRPYICHACGAAFKVSAALKAHSLIHSGERPYPCKHCEQAFQTKSGLNRHFKRMHTKERPHECQYCEMKFATRSELDQHLPKHTGIKKFVCEKCGAAFSLASSLTRHMYIHNGNKPHVCSECGASFVKAHILRDHMRRHTGERPFVCDQCGRAYSTSADLRYHTTKSCSKLADTPRFACAECGDGFTSRRFLVRHMKVHPRACEKPFVCDQCGRAYITADGLRKHKKSKCIKQPDRQPFICTVCGKMFAAQGALLRHTLIHSQDRQDKPPAPKKPFFCGLCEQEFISSDSLRVHRSKYCARQLERRHACDECGKTFTAQKYLTRHMLVHSQDRPLSCEKPFFCDECEQAYASYGSLQLHKSKYCPRQPVGQPVCGECGKSFSAPKYLTNHMVIHSQNKPHACDRCSASFARKYQLSRHLKIHALDASA